jgi:O-antigen ligase
MSAIAQRWRLPRLLPHAPTPTAGAIALGAFTVAVAGLAAGRSPQLVVVAAVAGALVVLTLHWLLWASVVFIFITFPTVLPGWLGIGSTVAKPLGFLLIAAWALNLLQTHGRAFLLRDRPLLAWLLVAYAAWASASLAWTVDAGRTTYGVQRLIPVVLLTFVIYTVASNRRQLLALIWTWAVTAGFWAAYALATGTSVAGARLTGGLNDPNYLASQLVFAVLVTGFLLGTTRRLGLRALLVILLVVDMTAFVQTESRGGIIGLGVALTAAVAIAGKTRGSVLALVAVLVAVVIGYVGVVAPAQLRHRVTTFSASQSSGRSDSWHIAELIWQNNPALGVGLGGYQVAQVDYVSTIQVQFVGQILYDRLVAHNTYLETLSELGAIGVLLLGGGIGIAFLDAGRSLRETARREDDEVDANIVRGLIAGSAGMLVAFFFVSAEYEKPLWIAIALLAATRPALARRAADPH